MQLSTLALFQQKKSDMVEGKQHVCTIPTRIRKVKNNLCNKRQDANFMFATKQYMKDITFLHGSENVFVLSADDKAKVPRGITAATKQSLLLMHLTYKIWLPYHNVITPSKHKLTLSVYSASEIRATSSRAVLEISYPGRTYIAICSAKYDSSATYRHGCDSDYVLQREQFQKYCKT